MSETSEHVQRNRASWESGSDTYQAEHVAQLNRWDVLGWGTYDVPEDEIYALGDVRGMDGLEFGCGGCQFGIKVAKRGANVVGLDFSATQLGHGLRNMAEAGVRFPVVQASGEQVPFRDGSLDLVFCDHGVMGFADPYRTVPEVARVLRQGGLFAFDMSTPIIWLTWGDDDAPPGRELLRDYFGMRSATWDDPRGASTEFQLPYGEWIRLFRRNGLLVEDLIELRPAEDATTTYDHYAPLEWARRFPGEHIWKVRKG